MFFEILSPNSHIRISLKSQSQRTSLLPTRASISSRLCSLMHIYFFHREELESYRTFYFPHFVKLPACRIKKKFLLQIVYRKTNTTKFSNLENDVMVVYIRSIKNVRPSMQSSHFQHNLSISWSIFFQDFFRVVMLEFSYSKCQDCFFYFYLSLQVN